MNKVLTKYIFLAAVLLLISRSAMAQREAGTPDPGATVQHVTVGGSVFGGGNLAPVAGNTEVKINQLGSTVEKDVYGGGALANVGTDNNNTTIVELLDGIINGNVYGGGLGDSIDNGYLGDTTVAALVFSKVYVYVGTAPENPNDPSSEPTGHITINGDVFGCNNINGTPKDDVFVGIYRTAHTDANKYPEGVVTLNQLDTDSDSPNYDQKFAINAAYGGGNRASYVPNAVASGAAPHSTTVYVWGCTENTVKTVYGGGNAANVGTDAITANTNILIDGGRFDRIFGGGNGYSADYNHDKPYKEGDDCTATPTNEPCEDYNPGANIYGIASTTIVGGLARQVFGGSNQYGNLNGVVLNIDKHCDTLLVFETFGGGNEADLTANLTTTLGCSDYMIGTFYGGSNLADVTGDVVLNVNGGNYTNVFGGSKGRLANTSVTEKAANINGTVTLNLHGGNMVNAFGGNDVKGRISGLITVNLLEQGGCGLQVDTIYGGGRDAEYAPDSISGKKMIAPLVNLLHGTVGHVKNDNTVVHGCVFGGGKGALAVVKAHPKVTIGDLATGEEHQVIVRGSAIGGGSVFGGGNAAEVDGIDSVLMMKSNNLVVNIFGGGNKAVADTAVVIMTAGTVDTIFGGGNLAGLAGTTRIDLSNGTVKKGIYGGSNISGTIADSITVNITGGQVGTSHTDRAYIHGGGFGHGTSTNSHVLVNIDGATIYGDVYGGSGYGDVNAACDTTTVNVLSGTIYGDVYGGGLGKKSPNYAAKVNGKVFVNIGKDENTGSANISTYTVNDVEYGGNVFGCNNANGSPQDSVFVNIYHTAHGDTPQTNAYPTGIVTLSDLATNSQSQKYAINAVYGGGNEAAYTPALNTNQKPKSTTVHIYGCQNNTIKEVYGGGNAANVGTTGDDGESTNTFVIIDGGRINRVFGGGRGDNTDEIAANIYGTATTNIYAGLIDTIFGGGNLRGDIDSISLILAHNTASCADEVFNQVFGGANLAALSGSLNTTIKCGVEEVGDIYGGSNLATIGGNISLNIRGGRFNTVFGGSKGSNVVDATIGGDVELNLNGGTMVNAFGGSNVQGNIYKTITVTVLDTVTECPLQVDTIYGGGLEAYYTPTNTAIAYPLVRLLKGTVGHTTGSVATPGCIFGGGKGSGATVTANPKVIIGDIEHADYQAIVLGNVFGGGNLAEVVGIDSVLMQNSNSRADTIFGGGNLANVSGSNVVVINGGTVNHDVYGGGALANTGGSKVTLAGGTVTHDIYGGGLGDGTHPAALNGAVQVTVNSGTVGGDVYGCNNINGAPQSTVKVDIYDATPATGATYAISNVFGGGNLAAYNYTPEVTIHNCDNSIGYVYGGGNKASVGGTKVDVYGGNTIGNVFAGGNGEGLDYNYTMVTGNAIANIYGGTIGKVFGGNNNRGVINGSTIEVNVNKQTEPGEGHSPCPMYIGEVYGGGNLAHGKAAKITIGCTGTIVDGPEGHIAHHERIGTTLEGIGTVYGGANEANIIDSSDDIVLDINSGIIDTVFGGNNKSGAIDVTIQVNIEKTGNCDWFVGDVYGGGNHADYEGMPDVNIIAGTVYRNVFGGGNDITDGTKGVTNSDVEMTGGTVLLGVYGGCNLKGTVTENSLVKIYDGTIGSQSQLAANPRIVAQVFGGGLGQNTNVNGNVEVNFGTQSDTHSEFPKLYGDIYGGSALGNVNTNNTNTTTVNILNGTIETVTSDGTTANGQYYYIYHGGNVYGGGLGEKVGVDGGTSNIEAKVNGVVFVNIGTHSRSGRDLNPEEDLNIGRAIIKGNVYGCNNTNGSPQDSVTVHIYRTHRDAKDEVTYHENDATFAIPNVFGGGNRADYKPAISGRKLKVWIHGCYNTIERVFGGSNAAAAGNGGSGTSVVVNTLIDGGRFDHVFGGGNGEVSAADIFGDVDLEIHGGYVEEFYVGSNQQGSISGVSNVLVDQSSGCEEIDITEFFCGGKYADFFGNIEVTIKCSDGLTVNDLYGGCKEAMVRKYPPLDTPGLSAELIALLTAHPELIGTGGNIHLVVKGGTYDHIYGGSKGKADNQSIPGNDAISADIEGNVLLEVIGGTVMDAIYGGCNILGDIAGKVIVNVEDGDNEGCALDVSIADVYGGGNKADYNTTEHAEHDYPQVNIRNATVKNVFGGGYQAKVTGNPKIKIKKGSKILGNVYGGGNMGEVVGSPKVTIDGKDNSESPHTY